MASLLVRITIVAFLPCVVFAKGSGAIERGGLGFLYSDHNSFSNPGHFATASGIAVGASYDTASSGAVQNANTSVVFGGGSYGLGVFGNRVGSNLSTAGAFDDHVGAGLGVSLVKGKFLVGVGYRRELSSGQTNDGRVDATMTLMNGKGVSIGLGATSELNSDNDEVRTATVALGFPMAKEFSFELDGVFNNLTTTNDYTAGAFLTRSGQKGYLSAGYQWHSLVSKHGAAARLGVVLGRSMDISVYASHVFITGSNPAYGGSFRVAL